MAVPDRYYAQYTTIDNLFLSQHINGWQVFDREAIGPQGDTRAICFCINRAQAFKIRDALNNTYDRTGAYPPVGQEHER